MNDEPASRDIEPRRLTPPRMPLVRMAVFLALTGFIAFIMHEQIFRAFMANPGLNGVIGGVLLIGIILAMRQVGRLFREVSWINDVNRSGGPIIPRKAPVLLAPMQAMLGQSIGRSAISTATLRSVLDSTGLRLDETRDVLRYLTGLLVFLGLLGTFWGLIETMSSVSKVVNSLQSGNDTGALFDELKAGLIAPLAGMGISFSSSLFGLAGSLIMGFLDLQAGQTQNRFYNELEDWLSTYAADPAGGLPGSAGDADLRAALDKISRAAGDAGSSRAAANATIHLAEGIQGLVHHMRGEQQMIRDWMEAQADVQKDVKKLLERLAREPRDRV